MSAELSPSAFCSQSVSVRVLAALTARVHIVIASLAFDSPSAELRNNLRSWGRGSGGGGVGHGEQTWGAERTLKAG